MSMESTRQTPILPEFTLSLGPCDAGRTTITLRYCFKGVNVPSRLGGFRTKSGTLGNAFVMKNLNDDCAVFGEYAGEVYFDTEDNNNEDKYGNDGTNGLYYLNYCPFIPPSADEFTLHFCKIGEQNDLSNSDDIEIGEFNQTFGFFSKPDNSQCPVLESPYGKLSATKETIFMDLENRNAATEVIRGDPPFVINSNKDGTVAFCVYDPSNGVKN